MFQKILLHKTSKRNIVFLAGGRLPSCDGCHTLVVQLIPHLPCARCGGRCRSTRRRHPKPQQVHPYGRHPYSVGGPAVGRARSSSEETCSWHYLVPRGLSPKQQVTTLSLSFNNQNYQLSSDFCLNDRFKVTITKI